VTPQAFGKFMIQVEGTADIHPLILQIRSFTLVVFIFNKLETLFSAVQNLNSGPHTY
jgi:hypothetical protein